MSNPIASVSGIDIYVRDMDNPYRLGGNWYSVSSDPLWKRLFRVRDTHPCDIYIEAARDARRVGATRLLVTRSELVGSTLDYGVEFHL